MERHRDKLIAEDRKVDMIEKPESQDGSVKRRYSTTEMFADESLRHFVKWRDAFRQF